MLKEAFIWLTTPCAPATRHLGYLTAAIGLESRARRCRAAWAPHLDHCRAAVRQSMQEAMGHRHAVLFGSGLGLEYALDEIAATFQEVTLVDIVHLPGARRRARRYANVRSIELDLTGCAAFLYRHGKTAGLGEALAAVAAHTPNPALFPSADWVVSCNLLSQLPLQPLAWLRRHRPDWDEAALEQLRHALIARHLELLGAFDARRCLVADAEQTLRDRHGKVIERTNYALRYDLERHAYACWQWQMAPRGELADGMSAEHRVVACHWPANSNIAKMFDDAPGLA